MDIWGENKLLIVLGVQWPDNMYIYFDLINIMLGGVVGLKSLTPQTSYRKKKSQKREIRV